MRSFCNYFLCLPLVCIANNANAGFLQATDFPKTINDTTFEYRVQNQAAGYAPYKDASAYNSIQLQSLNDELADEIDRIEKEQESYCMGPGKAEPECQPYVPSEDTENASANTQNQSTENSQSVTTINTNQPTLHTASNTPIPNGTPGRYCALKHPHIPANQTAPLGIPVSPELDLYTAVQNGRVCSPFNQGRGGGWQHMGVDIGCKGQYFDTPIFATADGVVGKVGHDTPDSTAGNYILINHANGFSSYYMHLNKIYVTQGQQIKAGCQVGTMGHTGGSMGLKKQGKPFRIQRSMTHLHYELHNKNKPSVIKTPKGNIRLEYMSGKNAFNPIELLKYKH